MLVLWLAVMLGCKPNWSDQEACQEYVRAECECGLYSEEICSSDSQIADQCDHLESKEGNDEQQAFDECAIDAYDGVCDWGGIYETCCEQHPGAADCG